MLAMQQPGNNQKPKKSRISSGFFWFGEGGLASKSPAAYHVITSVVLRHWSSSQEAGLCDQAARDKDPLRLLSVESLSPGSPREQLMAWSTDGNTWSANPLPSCA